MFDWYLPTEVIQDYTDIFVKWKRRGFTVVEQRLSSQSGRLWLLPTLSVCVCVCLSVCPAFTAYISITMGWNLIKLGGIVGT